MNVGDYVRTENGEIGTIIDCPEQLKKDYGKWLWFETTEEQRPIRREQIEKSSPNIIDIIEAGDYVNGYKVTFAGATMWDNDGNVIKKGVEINRYSYDTMLRENSIESIVTKEQFESMKYKVGD